MPKPEKPKPDALGGAREVMRRMVLTKPTPHEEMANGKRKSAGKRKRRNRGNG